MLGTIVLVEEPRSKAEQGAEFPPKNFQLARSPKPLFQGMHVRASPHPGHREGRIPRLADLCLSSGNSRFTMNRGRFRLVMKREANPVRLEPAGLGYSRGVSPGGCSLVGGKEPELRELFARTDE